MIFRIWQQRKQFGHIATIVKNTEEFQQIIVYISSPSFCFTSPIFCSLSGIGGVCQIRFVKTEYSIV